MSVAWTLRPSATTAPVGHSFSTGGGNDVYGNTRWMIRFDLSGLTAPGTAAPDSSSGAITRTETVPSGSGPTPASP